MQDIQSIIEYRYLIADQLLIKEMEEKLSLVDNDEYNWSKSYLDTLTGQKWLVYRLDSRSHGGGTLVIVKLPLPETGKLVDLVIESQYNDEVFAACRILVENEEMEFRLELICRLEKLNDKSKRISIIEYTDLDSPINRKDITGKSYDQITSESKYYKDIAGRSRGLM